jgi:acyl carrier protein
MTPQEIRTKVLQILGGIAPDVPFREQIDIDSMDYLNFVIALDEEFKANIPERDYTKFITVNACVEQLLTLSDQVRAGS